MAYNRTRQDNWWKRRTKLEKQLSCIAFGMFFLAIILLSALVFYSQYGVPKGVCLTSRCVQAAAIISSKLEEQIDPCDDFYSFACGGFMKKTTIPDDISAYNSFTEVGEKLMRQLRSILEEPSTHSDSHAVNVVKTYYKSCMNEDSIEQEGLVEAQTLLNSLGGWPVVEEAWDPNNFDWAEQLIQFKEKGLDFNFLLSISAGKDFRESSKRIIDIDQPDSFGIGSYILRKGIHDPIVKSYLELMFDFAVMFGANDFKASEDMESVLNLEMELAKKTVQKIDKSNTSLFYNKMTLKTLKQQYGTIDWMKLLRNILPEEVKLYDEKEVLVQVPEYIDGLERILKATPPKTIANYLMWRAVLGLWHFLPKRFDERVMKLNKVINGVAQDPPRWKKCLDITKKHIPILLAATYIRRYFNNDEKRYAEEIVKNIIEAFKYAIENSKWMDERTKHQSLEKASSLIAHVAFPAELLDDEILDEMYSGIYVSDKLFLQSFLNINKFEWNRLLRRILEPVTRNDWRETIMPIEINAFYYRLENSMILPAAILQGVFFNRNRPSYLNYGAIGSIVGHEIVHAFDDRGSQFDKYGNLRNWWEEETQVAFTERAKCFVEKYNSMRIEEIQQNVSGSRTLSENIADNGGIKQAYLAYNLWTNKNGEESKLPGLKYTPSQLFWIAGAQNWCSKERIEYLKQKASLDPHAPDKCRVNGNYQNVEYFAKDFKCPLGSQMNPRKKCSLW